MSTAQRTTPSPGPRGLIHPSPCQIDPSDGYAYYQIRAQGSLLAEIVATKVADRSFGSGMAAGIEYWMMASPVPLRTAVCSHLTVTRVRSGTWHGAGAPPFNAADASFTVPVAARWGGQATVSCQKESGAEEGFDVDISAHDGHWQGTMRFYNHSGDLMFKTIADGDTKAFTQSVYSYTYSCVITLP